MLLNLGNFFDESKLKFINKARMADVQQVSAENIVEKAKEKDATIVGRYKLIKNEISAFFPDESESTQLTKEIMKEFNLFHGYKNYHIPAINYEIMVNRVIRDYHDEDEQLNALKNEFKIYKEIPEWAVDKISSNTIKHWRYSNLLTFGYISKMERNKMIINGIPFGVILLILQFFSNKHYEYEEPLIYVNITKKALKEHMRKVSIYWAIDEEISGLIQSDEERNTVTKELIHHRNSFL